MNVDPDDPTIDDDPIPVIDQLEYEDADVLESSETEYDAIQQRDEQKRGEKRIGDTIPSITNITNIETVLGGVSQSGSANVSFAGSNNTSRQSGKFTVGTVNRIQSIYVPPPKYAQVFSALKEKCIVILQGKRRIGKVASALHLLSELVKSDKISEIDLSLEVQELKSFNFEPNEGYLIDSLTQPSESDTNLLEDISRRLQLPDNKRSYLVITVNEQIILPQEFSRYVVNWNDLPDKSQVFDNHLKWYAPDCYDQALAVSKDSDIKLLLEEKESNLPPEIDALSDLICQVAKGTIEIEQVSERLTFKATQKIKGWFDSNQSTEVRAFMIALATLNKNRFYDIDNASRLLYAKIVPFLDEETETEKLDFWKSHQKQLEQVLAHSVHGIEQTHFGSSSVELIEFVNRKHQRLVLQHIWSEFYTLRPIFINWLAELSQHEDFNVRASVASCAGILSEYDFRLLLSTLITPWAKHNSIGLRMLAAFALGVPAWNSESAPKVLSLLRSWSKGGNFQMRQTAAMACGGWFGVRFPESAIANLKEIAERGRGRQHPIVQNSMLNLFESGHVSPELYHLYSEVLVAFQAWSDDRHNNPLKDLALDTFLIIATESKVKSPPYGKPWPTLLWLVAEDGSNEKQVATLLSRCVNTQSTKQDALNAINQWIKAVTDDKRLARPMLKIIKRLVTRQGNRELLVYYLEMWSEDDNYWSLSASSLLKKL